MRNCSRHWIRNLVRRSLWVARQVVVHLREMSRLKKKVRRERRRHWTEGPSREQVVRWSHFTAEFSVDCDGKLWEGPVYSYDGTFKHRTPEEWRRLYEPYA